MRRIVTIGMIFALCTAGGVKAQDSTASFPVRVNGSVSLSTDLYESSGDENWQPRQGASVSRAIARVNVNLFDQIDLPFEVYATTEETGYRQPFNQFGASPRLFGWLTLHGGYFSARVSDFTFGDMRLLGGGVELAPGNFRLSLVHGTARQAQPMDTSLFFAGEYRRTVTAAKIGFGSVSGGFAHLNFVRAIDDTTTLDVPVRPGDSIVVLPPAAKENAALSLSFGIPFLPEVRLTGEVGIAATSDDITAPETDNMDIPSFLLTARTSTHVDAAAKASLSIVPSGVWSVRLDGRWIGPGFTTLGYPQMQNDVLEGTVSPAVRLFENTLYLRASLGLRRNNLRSTKIASSDRIIGSLFAGIQFSREVGLDVQYSNYSLQSQHVNDTLRMANVFQNISLTPRFLFEALGGQNTLTLTYAYQTVEDNNPVTAQAAENTTHSGAAAHTLVLQSGWSFGSSVFFNSISSAALSTDIFTLSETVTKQLFDNALSVSGSVSLSFVGTDTRLGTQQISGSDNQVYTRIGATYNIPSWGSVSLNLSTNSYSAGKNGGRPSYTEYRAGLGYSISL